MDAKTAACEADIAELKAADTALQGTIAGVAVTVNDISSTTIPTLVEEYNELKSGLDIHTTSLGILDTRSKTNEVAIADIKSIELPGIKSSVTTEADVRKANDSYLSGVIDNIIKDYTLSADVTAVKNALTADDHFLSGKIDDLRSDLSDYALSGDVTAIRSDLTGQISPLATEVGKKLAKTEFSTLSISIGLNTASSTDKVAVKSDLTSFITKAALTPYVLKSTVRNALNGINGTSDVAEIGAALKNLYDALA